MTSRASSPAERAAFEHDGIAFGCDYNPEQWSREVWQEDVVLMREAGVDLVAINIFGWSSIEPRDGIYDFDGLDAIIDLLHANGIRVNLGTGTASTPAWLTTKHPEILPIMADGTTRFPGGRQAWCPSSPIFRERALQLVDKVAERYGTHPAVALWHVSNELGCHNSHCFNDETAVSFRGWLQQRYESIDRLNEAWGTSFWSQRYSDWAEILPPKLTVSTNNPSQLVDFHRFSSDELLDYYRSEYAVIRQHSSIPITTNFMVTAHIKNMDYWQWAPDMDVIANDHYLDHRLDDPTAELAFSGDLTRGLAQGEPWILMEHSTGAVNWQPLNLAKQPGEMMRNSLTHVARGADGVCFFQWRASLQGSEKFHSSLVPHAGTDTALWREVVELGATLDRLDEVAGSRVVADVAIVFSWESWWSADGQSRPSQSVDYLQQMHAAHAALRELGITTDIVAPNADLSSYRMVIVPGLYMVSDAEAANINDYVANGGHALVTFFSGIVDEQDRVRPGGYPGAFREMLGVRVEEFVPLVPSVRVTLDTGREASLWTERLHSTGAQVLARYSDGPVAGMPALTRNRFGHGVGLYLATALEREGLKDVLRTLATDAGVVPAGPESDGSIEVVRRASAGASYLFVINHSADDVDIPATGTELVTGEYASTHLRVAAGAVRVLKEESAV